jgi:hypothetical protein
MRKLYLLTPMILFLGCEERFEVYTQGKENTSKINCLRYDVGEKLEKEMMLKALKFQDDPTCEYSINLTKYHVKSCNNPQTKSLGADFDGYVRVEILKNDETIYKAQSDFKSDEIGAFKRVLSKTSEELK